MIRNGVVHIYFFDFGGEVAQRGRGEKRGQGEVEFKNGTHARSVSYGKQRVAAEVEEIAADANPLEGEHVAPDPAERLLHRRARRHVAVVDDLKRLLGEHPGDSPVLLHLGERQVLRLPPAWTVDVAPGLLADLIAVEGNPLERIDALRQVTFVMKDGIVFKRDGVVTPEEFFNAGPVKGWRIR